MRKVALAALVSLGGGGGGGGGPPGDTVYSLGMVGGQVDTRHDYSAFRLEADLMHCARACARTTGSTDGKFLEGSMHLRVQSIVRTSNVARITVIGWENGDQHFVTGQQLILKAQYDSSFDTDYVTLTRVSDNVADYASTGPDATLYLATEFDVAADVYTGVSQDPTTQQPNAATFYCRLASVSGDTTSIPDLHTTWTGHFDVGIPTGMVWQGANLTWVPGAATFTVVVTNTADLSVTFTGWPSDGKLPRIHRVGDVQDGSLYCRPDAASLLKPRVKFLRFMDAGKANSNALVKSAAKRPKVVDGRGMPIELMVKMCNELDAHFVYVFPHYVENGYVDEVATYARENLKPGLLFVPEYDNEPWNSDFAQWHWGLADVRKETKALLKGYDGVNEITSISKSGGTVTVVCSRSPTISGITTGATVALFIGAGDAGYDVTSATCTVAGNNVSFAGPAGSGTANFTQAALYGNRGSILFSDGLAYSPYELHPRQHARRTYEIMQRVLTVFTGQASRVRPMLMWKCANYTGQFGDVQRFMLPWLTAQYGPVSNWLYYLGAATYANCTSQTTTAGVKTSVMAATDELKPFLHSMAYLCAKYGVHQLHYEGGPGLNALGGNSALINGLYLSPDYRDAQKYLCDVVYAHGCEVLCQYYSSISMMSATGAQTWGWSGGIDGRTIAQDAVVGSAASSRLQGIDLSGMAAVPANADINALPGTLFATGGSTYKDDQESTFNANGMLHLYNASSISEWGFYAAAGTVAIKVKGAVKVGFGANGLRIFLNGSLVGSLNLPTTSGDIDVDVPNGGIDSAGSINLVIPSTGYHVLTLKPPVSIPDQMGVSRVFSV